MNKRRSHDLLEFSECCVSCMSKLKEIDEYIEKAKKANKIKVTPEAVEENKSGIAAVYDTTTEFIYGTAGAVVGGVVQATKIVGGMALGFFKWGCKQGYDRIFGGTPQPPNSKQRCHIVKVFDAKCDGVLDLLRCYVCVELNLFFGTLDGIKAPMDFDFKKYEFEGNKNFEDKCFKDRTIYRIKPVEVTVGRLGNVKLHVFISPNPTKTGELVSIFTRKNWITVDGDNISIVE